MTDKEAILLGAFQDPTGFGFQVYADWLEERQDPTAGAWRHGFIALPAYKARTVSGLWMSRLVLGHGSGTGSEQGCGMGGLGEGMGDGWGSGVGSGTGIDHIVY